jgi:hypothetical protein
MQNPLLRSCALLYVLLGWACGCGGRRLRWIRGCGGLAFAPAVACSTVRLSSSSAGKAPRSTVSNGGPGRKPSKVHSSAQRSACMVPAGRSGPGHGSTT